jgi:5'-methylthioadenosine phosphorylase
MERTGRATHASRARAPQPRAFNADTGVLRVADGRERSSPAPPPTRGEGTEEVSERQQTEAVGVIGGSGLYDILALRTCASPTPFGAPSDACDPRSLVRMVFLRVTVADIEFERDQLPREHLGHEARRHASSPSRRWARCARHPPGHFVVIDQFFDRRAPAPTRSSPRRRRASFADPCTRIAPTLLKRANRLVCDGGTYVNMEGRSSHARRVAHLPQVGSTSARRTCRKPSSRAKRDCCATIAMATDYDCWHEGHDAVTVSVIAVMNKNIGNAKN